MVCAMDDDDSSDWIGAYAAAKLAKERTGSIQDDALLLRARDGLMTARAREYVEGDGSEDKIYTMHTLPKRFFWAGFGSALDKNWVTGDFSTWIGRELHCRAYGVEFRRLEVEAAFPKVSPESSPTLQLAKHSDTMGRRADVRLVGAKRGPKPKIDQLKFNAEVARLLEEEECPIRNWILTFAKLIWSDT